MTIKVNPNTCPKCGATIPPDAPQGLCPKCVLLGAATPTDAGLPPAATAEIPSRERVATAFPQLEILELLGRGGMGFVFKARQPNLDRFVALKLLPDKLARDPHFAERFSREARLLARLNHPGIVTIYDFGQAAGFYFLLMEYVDGVNLRQAMRAGRFSPAAALSVVPKICEALQFAHEQGVLHRDIKPENILLDAKGRVKIADFGIAKLVGDEKPDFNLTATGATIGTPQYMAPEQLEQPGTVDHRADIYSLGVVFYELLTGELPIGRFSPPSQRTPMDPRVDEVVMRTLEKEREKRFQSAGEVKTNVEHLTEVGAGAFKDAAARRSSGGTVIIKPEAILPGVPWWQQRGVIKWALIAVLVCGIVAVLWTRLLPHQRPGSASALAPLPEGMVELVALSREPADGVWWRPDGTPANEGAIEIYGTTPQVGPGERAVRFIFRSRDAERQDASRTYDIAGAKSWISGGPPRLNGNKLSGGSFVTATFPESLSATTVRVGVALDAWETVATDAGTATGTFNFSRHGQARKVALFGAIEDRSGDTILTLTHDLPEEDVRVVAVDDQNRERASTTRHATGERQRFTLPDLAPERVREYRFQVRPYRWAEFKNVQLSPASSVSIRAPLGGAATHSLSAEASAPEVTLAVSAPPRETLIITGIVLSNGLPLPGEPLRAKLWPSSGLKPSPFVVQWKIAADANPGGAPWEIVVEDATANTIAARLRPPHLPRLDWKVSPSAANLGKLSVTREARTFEVARALQTSDGGAVDWSVRIQLQSSPHSTASSRGIKADFVLPANQVAVFELVTRSNGVIVPVPGLTAHHINGTPAPYSGKFILADDPDDLDSLTGLPRWTFGILGPDGRLTSQGLAVPAVPPDFNFTMQLWKALQPDQEVVEGLSDSTSGRQAYGLRIRTQTVKLQSGLHLSSSGYGTNWMPAVARHLASASTNTPWMQFTFTAIELRELEGKRWLAIDYLDEVQGDCQKSFPWETKIPGFRAEVRTSEFAKDPSDNSAPRHQRVEYLLPDSLSRAPLEQLRNDVEKALKHKSIRLELGQEKLLFEFGSSSDTALKAWIKVIPPGNP
jgi:predicted Ser/Thr protein kinase